VNRAHSAASMQLSVRPSLSSIRAELELLDRALERGQSAWAFVVTLHEVLIGASRSSAELNRERNASYKAKNAASTSPGLRHLCSARHCGFPSGQALARAYKILAPNTSSGTMAALELSRRRFRAHSAVCLTRSSKSGN